MYLLVHLYIYSNLLFTYYLVSIIFVVEDEREIEILALIKFVVYADCI